jgi:Dyp-type peroxidase family
MTAVLKLNDIQGNIIKGYGRFGFPFARYIFFSVLEENAGRSFVRNLIPMVMTAVPWKTKPGSGQGIDKPESAINIAFTYEGLKALSLPVESLHSFPDDFSMGMRGRHSILGDDDKSAPENWDPIWNDASTPVAIFVAINAQTPAAVEKAYAGIEEALHKAGDGVRQLVGHRGEDRMDNLPYQDASAIFENGAPVAKEYFGYTDGISDPFFKGTGQNPAYAIGSGKPTGHTPGTIMGWEPLETGEFLLGHRDEARELPQTPSPHLLGHNGTFMVYRKLHQNTGAFKQYLAAESQRHPENDEEVIAAKFVGRWRNGAPLTLFPTEEEGEKFMAELSDAKEKLRKARGTIEEIAAEARYLLLLSKLVGFDYTNDLDGSRCPVGAHTRRCNPRSALEFGVKGAFDTPGALSNRRRILRRGLPYGSTKDAADTGNHGIIFMALAASISRQFEFTQQQWINYGNDFKLANEKDAILGNHHTDKNGAPDGRMMFPATAGSGKSPHFCSHIPRFVETRGGEYFFIPSMTALQMIADGTVDPT